MVRHLPPSWTRPVLCSILLLFCVGVPAVAAIRNVTTYGATGNGTTDDTAAINSAIAALVPGDELYFSCPASFYLVTSLNAITVNNVTVAGQTGCSGGTVMVKGSSGIVMTIGAYGVSSSTPLLSTATELSSTISANWSAIGVVAGSYIYIEAGGAGGGTHTCGGSGCRSEVLKIASVSSNVATVTTAVHQTYDLANLPWVEKVLNPVSGISVHDLIIDGSNTAYGDLKILNTVDSAFTNLTIQHSIGGGSGFPALAGGALYLLRGFNVSFTNMTVTGAGSSSCANCSASELAQAGNLSVNGYSIHNLNAGSYGHGTTGIYVNQLANSTFTNLSIDSAGTGGGGGGGGRSIKLNSAGYNTLNGLTVTHTEGGYLNGLSIEYFSSRNIFNDCSVTNLSGTNAGIQIFGDSQGQQEGNNNNNNFNNCTIHNTTNIPVWILDNNTGNTFNGGTYAGVSGEPVFGVGNSAPCCSNNTNVNNVAISGPGTYGISVLNGSTGACINTNTFAASSGLSAGINVTAASDIGSGNVLNGYSSNLSAGTCGGGDAPAPPSGLTAAVQ